MSIKLPFTIVFQSLWLFGLALFMGSSENTNTQTTHSQLNNVNIPLKRAGNLLLIDATVDGVSGSFILDTGAPGLVLNSTYFRDGRPTYHAAGGGITGNTIQRKTKRVEKFSFSGLSFNQLSADVINLSHIENMRGVKILGLIGTSLINDFEMVIDTKNMSLRMHRIDRKGELIEPVNETIAYTIHQKVILTENVIVTYLPIGGKNICLCLDTGAEKNVLDNQNHRKVLEQVTITGRSHLAGASSQRIEVIHGQLHNLNISGHNITNMNVILLDLSTMKKGFNIGINGMLGFDFFQMGIIRINLQNKLMSIALYEEN